MHVKRVEDAHLGRGLGLCPLGCTGSPERPGTGRAPSLVVEVERSVKFDVRTGSTWLRQRPWFGGLEGPKEARQRAYVCGSNPHSNVGGDAGTSEPQLSDWEVEEDRLTRARQQLGRGQGTAESWQWRTADENENAGGQGGRGEVIPKGGLVLHGERRIESDSWRPDGGGCRVQPKGGPRDRQLARWARRQMLWSTVAEVEPGMKFLPVSSFLFLLFEFVCKRILPCLNIHGFGRHGRRFSPPTRRKRKTATRVRAHEINWPARPTSRPRHMQIWKPVCEAESGHQSSLDIEDPIVGVIKNQILLSRIKFN